MAFEARAVESKPSFHASLNAALEAAATDKSPVLLVISAAGTRSAREVEEAFTADNLTKFGALKIAHLDTDLNPGLVQTFSVSVLPSFILLGPDAKVISRHDGFGGMDELLDWLKEARSRMARGEWEGASSTKTVQTLAAKAAKGGLTDDDLLKMAADLANPDPAERSQIAGILTEQRERAIPPLLEKLNDPYLGVRVASSELLRRMLPGAPEVDPWLGPKDAGSQLAALKKWWTQAGKLPDKPKEIAPDPLAINSMRSAIEKVRTDEPLVRTEAMSALVRFGEEALPLVREAIKRSEKNGDQRSATFLEEVRWSILIPAAAEELGGGLRQALARGTGPERQNAAARLARCGASGIPALAELVDDTDPLVVETAVRSLSTVGGSETIPAMAALLKAGNSNLRMTAAQAMGKTKRKEAIPHLVSAVDDSNEVVACAALAAIEEISSKADHYNSKSVELPPEALAAIKGSLADPRWRVRATAVEIAGKLSLNELQEDARKLLHDPDSFVVKTALLALKQLGDSPAPAELADLIKRAPALRPEIIALMVEKSSPDVIKTVTDLFLAGKPDDQVSILKNLRGGGREGPREIDLAWKPLLTHAINSPAAQLRAAAADLLPNATVELSADLVGSLLADADPNVRRGAAIALLGIYGASEGARVRQSAYAYGDTEKKKFTIPDEKKIAWNAALSKSTAPSDIFSALALYLTADGKSPLQPVEAALAKIDDVTARQLAASGALASFLPKLSWPESKAILEKLRSHPVLLATAAATLAKLKPEAADFLLDPPVVVSVLEKADEQNTAFAITALTTGALNWSLYFNDARAKALLPLLLESKNPKWKSAALSAFVRAGSETNLPIFTNALASADPSLRAIAVQGISKSVKDRARREILLAPSLADDKATVRRLAALAMLDTDILESAQLQHYLTGPVESSHFMFGYSGEGDDRPLPAPLPKPPFLNALLKQLPTLSSEELPAIALLLAQYGVFNGLDRLVASYGKEGPAKSDPGNELLIAVALSKDAKYIPILRTMASDKKDEYTLRRILRAIKGMTGREAREFRVELNKLLRKST